MDRYEIRDIVGEEDLNQCAEVIRVSFATVAEEFNIDVENCPAHPSFITTDKLDKMVQRGVRIFGLFMDERMVGCVALETSRCNLCNLEKLAVLPDYRHTGLGRLLVDHIFAEATKAGVATISIATVDEHTVLKRWYEAYGFKVTKIEHFPHLPFKVCFMELSV